MKKTILFTLLSLFLFTLPGCAAEQKSLNNNVVDYNPNRNIPRLYDYPNQPDGFLDLPWYISLEEAERIKQTKFEILDVDDRIEGRVVYGIPDQGAEIFGVYFPVVGYTFIKDELVAVGIEFIKDPKQEAYQQLLTQMTSTYGKNPEVKKFADGNFLIWPGTKTYIDLKYDFEMKAVYTSFLSPSVAYYGITYEEIQKDRERKAAELQ